MSTFKDQKLTRKFQNRYLNVDGTGVAATRGRSLAAIWNPINQPTWWFFVNFLQEHGMENFNQ